MLSRLAADVALFILVFIAPWWITLLVAFVLVFLFQSFYEFLIVAFIIDTLYGAPLYSLHGFSFIVSSVAVVLFVLSIPLKRRLKFYQS